MWQPRWRSVAFGTATTIARSADGAAAPRLRNESEIRDLDIAFYRGRADRDPRGAADRAQLGRLYLERARERGDPADLIRAEESARHSLSLRRSRNGAALAILASSLLGQHRFVEALATAERLLALDSTSVGARGMVGEIQLELGRYDEARRTFGMLAMRRTDPSVAARYARWEEVTGRPEEARRLLREARDVAVGSARRARGTAGLVSAPPGRARHASRPSGGGRQGNSSGAWHTVPMTTGCWAPWLGSSWLQGRARRAIDYGERALGGMLDPTTLGVLHDAHQALGDGARAEQYARAMELAVLNQPGPLHRAWSMFLLDHGRDVATVLARAQDEIRTRQDVYGWDLLAWALHHAGRDVEARDAATRALAQDTPDAVLHYHAGMIALALADTADASRHLRRALEINPYWHPTQPGAVEALLDSL